MVVVTKTAVKFIVEKMSSNPINLMRRAGYVFQYQKDGEMSFVRPLARAGFPRFHCYTKIDGLNLGGNIHLDQKKETYGQETRHHGEYENDGVLQEEVGRLKEVFGSMALLA